MMKTFLLIVTLLAPLTLFCREEKPEHPFAIRWNTLSILGLSAAGEFEWSPSTRLGVFLGGGGGPEGAEPTSFAMVIGRRMDWEYCQSSGWGIYGGVRLGIPVGKLDGLAAKAILLYTQHKLAGIGCFSLPTVPEPIPDPFLSNRLGLYVAAAYAQPFCKRFFVEPLFGAGPELVSAQGRQRLSTLTLGFAMQLNLGVRF